MMRLSDVAEIDLPAAFVDKMAKNRDKYPAEQVYSSSAKYTEYRAKARGEAAERRDGRREAAERRAEEHRRSRRRSRGKMRGRSGRSRPRRVRVSASGACQPTWPKPTRVPPRESSSRQGGGCLSSCERVHHACGCQRRRACSRSVVEIDAASWASSVRERARAKAGVDQNGLASDATDDDEAAI